MGKGRDFFFFSAAGLVISFKHKFQNGLRFLILQLVLPFIFCNKSCFLSTSLSLALWEMSCSYKQSYSSVQFSKHYSEEESQVAVGWVSATWVWVWCMSPEWEASHCVYAFAQSEKHHILLHDDGPGVWRCPNSNPSLSPVSGVILEKPLDLFKPLFSSF